MRGNISAWLRCGVGNLRRRSVCSHRWSPRQKRSTCASSRWCTSAGVCYPWARKKNQNCGSRRSRSFKLIAISFRTVRQSMKRCSCRPSACGACGDGTRHVSCMSSSSRNTPSQLDRRTPCLRWLRLIVSWATRTRPTSACRRSPNHILTINGRPRFTWPRQNGLLHGSISPRRPSCTEKSWRRPTRNKRMWR